LPLHSSALYYKKTIMIVIILYLRFPVVVLCTHDKLDNTSINKQKNDHSQILIVWAYSS
jgi:hypothetical protein